MFKKMNLNILVHLRIREVDQLIPRSLYPSTSGSTYWQIESEQSLLNGKKSNNHIILYIHTYTYIHTYCLYVNDYL